MAGKEDETVIKNNLEWSLSLMYFCIDYKLIQTFIQSGLG